MVKRYGGKRREDGKVQDYFLGLGTRGGKGERGERGGNGQGSTKIFIAEVFYGLR